MSWVRVRVPALGFISGVRADGSKKIRPVDNFSWAPGGRGTKKERKSRSLNGHTALPEKLSHDHIDDLMAAVKAFIM